ncbi:MAG TPA: Maf family protein [Bacteroidota bacterium]|nr:Maf family protein [Bacteroidota bacterium]
MGVYYVMFTLPDSIILASQSPRRAQLLRQIGLQFETSVSGVEELFDPALSPDENARILSLKKAADVASRYDHGIVLGSDTIVVLDGSLLGKPESADEARRMLALLSGRTHTVYTGFALVDAETKKTYIDCEHTDVTFRTLDEDEIAAYVASGSPMDKAGAYGIQDDFGAVFVDRINGDYYTVVGLPLSKVYCAVQMFMTQLQKG